MIAHYMLPAIVMIRGRDQSAANKHHRAALAECVRNSHRAWNLRRAAAADVARMADLADETRE